MRALGGSDTLDPVRLTLTAVAGGLTVLSVTGWVVDVARDAGWRGSTVLTALVLASLLALLAAAAAVLVRGLDDELPAEPGAVVPVTVLKSLTPASDEPVAEPVSAPPVDPVLRAVSTVVLALTEGHRGASGEDAAGSSARPGGPDRTALVGLQTMDVVGADGMLVALHEGEALRFRAVGGLSETRVLGMTVPVEGSLTGYVIESGRPLRVDEVDDLPATRGFEQETPFGPLLILPVGLPGRGGAALLLMRLKGRPSFTLGDVARARILAPLMGPALELDGPSYLCRPGSPVSVSQVNL